MPRPTSPSSRRRWPVVALLVACSAVACTPARARTLSPVGPTTSAPRDPGTDGDARAVAPIGPVFVVGDSLTVGIEPYLPALLSGTDVNFDAVVGRPTSEGIAVVSGDKDLLPSTVVVALGTNDDPSGGEFSAHIDQMMALLGDRRVLWVNIARTGFSALNTALDDARQRYPNLEVVDWASVIADHRQDVTLDGVHLTDAGYELRAQVIAAALLG